MEDLRVFSVQPSLLFYSLCTKLPLHNLEQLCLFIKNYSKGWFSLPSEYLIGSSGKAAFSFVFDVSLASKKHSGFASHSSMAVQGLFLQMGFP